MSALPAPTSALAPDLDEARRFLAALAADDTEFTFQTFADDKKRKIPGLAKVLHGTFDEKALQLADLNARGAGVFITVNRTNGRGRRKEDITGVRAVYADFDGVPRENADRLEIAPHITVESSPGKWHIYYRTLGVPLSRFEGIQTALITLFGSDPQVTGCERVMRLPGFWHQKDAGAPFLTRIVEVTDERPYGLSDLPRGVEKDPSPEDEQSTGNVVAMPLRQEQENALAMAREKARRTHDTADGRKGPMRQLGFDLRAAGISQPTANLAAKLYAKECRPTNSEGQPSPFLEKDALDLVANAYKPGKVVNPRDEIGGQRQKKRHLTNHAGTMEALRNDVNLSDLIKYDEMSRIVVLTRSIPGGRFPGKQASELADHDVSALQEYLQRNGRPELSFDTLWKAIHQRARECTFHPVRDYLTALEWDGVDRLSTWLTNYLGAEDGDYSRAIGRMFVISLVARVFEPGCKVDYMIILEGEQSAAKSTACSVLGGNWFSDSLPDIGNDKDLSMHLNGRWLIEVSELASMSKADTNALKAFLTRTHERYRPPFGRSIVNEPRQCVFIGTTNKGEYLRDETGGRRFWPVRVADRIDIERLRAARDQLFAEAVTRYKRGEQWWPDRDTEATIIKPEQEARFEVDAWEETIVSRLSEDKPEKVTIADVLDYVRIDVDRQHSGHTRRAIAIMERIGWQRAAKRGTGGIRWWVPSPQWVPQGRPGGAAAAAKEGEEAARVF